MYFMDLWLLFPKFQGQALNFHLVKTAELLIISLPCMDLIYIITFGILNHTYIIFERFKQKHQLMFFFFFLKTKTSIRSTNIKFCFFLQKEEEKRFLVYNWVIDGWWTFYLKFQQASSCRESKMISHLNVQLQM